MDVLKPLTEEELAAQRKFKTVRETAPTPTQATPLPAPVESTAPIIPPDSNPKAVDFGQPAPMPEAQSGYQPPDVFSYDVDKMTPTHFQATEFNPALVDQATSQQILGKYQQGQELLTNYQAFNAGKASDMITQRAIQFEQNQYVQPGQSEWEQVQRNYIKQLQQQQQEYINQQVTPTGLTNQQLITLRGLAMVNPSAVTDATSPMVKGNTKTLEDTLKEWETNGNPFQQWAAVSRRQLDGALGGIGDIFGSIGDYAAKRLSGASDVELRAETIYAEARQKQALLKALAPIANSKLDDISDPLGVRRPVFDPANGRFGEMGQGLPGLGLYAMNLIQNAGMAAAYQAGDFVTGTRRQNGEYVNRFAQAFGGSDLGFANVRGGGDGKDNLYRNGQPVPQNYLSTVNPGATGWQAAGQWAGGLVLDFAFGSAIEKAVSKAAGTAARKVGLIKAQPQLRKGALELGKDAPIPEAPVAAAVKVEALPDPWLTPEEFPAAPKQIGAPKAPIALPPAVDIESYPIIDVPPSMPGSDVRRVIAPPPSPPIVDVLQRRAEAVAVKNADAGLVAAASPAGINVVEAYPGADLESMFIEADRVGNKYQTPVEVAAAQAEIAKVNQEVGQTIDVQFSEVPDVLPEPTAPKAPALPQPPKGYGNNGLTARQKLEQMNANRAKAEAESSIVTKAEMVAADGEDVPPPPPKEVGLGGSTSPRAVRLKQQIDSLKAINEASLVNDAKIYTVAQAATNELSAVADAVSTGMDDVLTPPQVKVLKAAQADLESGVVQTTTVKIPKAGKRAKRQMGDTTESLLLEVAGESPLSDVQRTLQGAIDSVVSYSTQEDLRSLQRRITQWYETSNPTYKAAHKVAIDAKLSLLMDKGVDVSAVEDLMAGKAPTASPAVVEQTQLSPPVDVKKVMKEKKPVNHKELVKVRRTNKDITELAKMVLDPETGKPVLDPSLERVLSSKEIAALQEKYGDQFARYGKRVTTDATYVEVVPPTVEKTRKVAVKKPAASGGEIPTPSVDGNTKQIDLPHPTADPEQYVRVRGALASTGSEVQELDIHQARIADEVDRAKRTLDRLPNLERQDLSASHVTREVYAGVEDSIDVPPSVVDEEWALKGDKPVYHGTQYDVQSLKGASTRGGWSELGSGFYFSDSQEVARLNAIAEGTPNRTLDLSRFYDVLPGGAVHTYNVSSEARILNGAEVPTPDIKAVFKEAAKELQDEYPELTRKFNSYLSRTGDSLDQYWLKMRELWAKAYPDQPADEYALDYFNRAVSERMSESGWDGVQRLNSDGTNTLNLWGTDKLEIVGIKRLPELEDSHIAAKNARWSVDAMLQKEYPKSKFAAAQEAYSRMGLAAQMGDDITGLAIDAKDRLDDVVEEVAKYDALQRVESSRARRDKINKAKASADSDAMETLKPFMGEDTSPCL